MKSIMIQHAKLAASKLNQAEEQQKSQLKLENLLQDDISILQRKITELCEEKSSSHRLVPKVFDMSTELEMKTANEIEYLGRKIDNLHRTEQVLITQRPDSDGELLQDQEQAAIQNYSGAESGKISSLKDISKTVRTLTSNLEEQKNNLKPQVSFFNCSSKK